MPIGTQVAPGAAKRRTKTAFPKPNGAAGPPLIAGIDMMAKAQAAARRTERADRQARIEQAAYFLAQRRGFTPGHELDDWLAAEAQIDSQSAALG